MKSKIIYYLPIAIEDLDNIVDYIKADSPKAALKILSRIDEAISNLSQFPEMGSIPKDKRLKKLGYRVMIIEKYLVFYVITDDFIEIRRIIHGSLNYKFLI